MTGQKKDWLKRFLEMGEAADFIVEFLLDIPEEEVPSMSNEDYGAYIRAKDNIKDKIKERKLAMKMQAR